MASGLYRQQALDRIASPERLDSPIRLVGWPQWLLLGGFALFAAIALAWAALTQAPVKIAGRGMLIDRAGLSEVVASDGGQIVAVEVSAGARVRAGQAIAILSRSERDREIADTRARLAQAQARLARLGEFYAGQSRSEGSAEAGRLAGIAATRVELERRRRVLEERAQRIAALAARGSVGRDSLISAEAAAAETRERIAGLDNEAARLRAESLGRDGRARLAVLDERNAVEQLERELARLTARAGDQSVVRAPTDGRIVELKLGAGDVVAPGSAIATLARETGAGAIVALAYVPAGEGRRMQPGMKAELLPDTVERQTYGVITGRVLAVSPLPATREGMRRAVRNDRLVEELLADGPVSEVQIALDRDPASASGFRWTTSRGPRRGVGIGTLVGVRVAVEHKRLLAWLVPGRM